MKTKKGFKRIAALLMCVVLLATSLPIALGASGETGYNPAPYFTDEAQKEGAAAWFDTEGDLQVRFPAATGRPTHAEWVKNADSTNVKAIDHYIVEISDLGKKLEKHNTVPVPFPTLTREVKASEVMALDADNKISLVYTKEELGELLNLEENRYNIAITAVDSEGWYSMSMYASIFDVPEFSFDMSKFEFFKEDPYAMREMMRFEIGGEYAGKQRQFGDTISSWLLNENTKSYSRAPYTGTVDPSVNETIASTAFRIRLDADPAVSGVTQIIDTPESRQTWDFSGADEIWYWMDLSDVELKGVSFRLCANQKWINYNPYEGKQKKQGDREAQEQTYSTTVYSTLGTVGKTYAAGEEPYVLVQNANGNWERKVMTDGTVDLGHTKGYIRIPIQFFCSETATEVTTNPSSWFSQQVRFDNVTQRDERFTSEVAFGPNDWISDDEQKYTVKVPVDPAGTAITDALLIQSGRMQSTKTYAIGEKNRDKYCYDLGTYLAPGITNEDIYAATNTRRATVAQDGSGNWTVQNRENAYKAIEDVYSAGFSYTGLGEGSVNHSIYIDNIMFYRTDGQPWNEAAISGFDGKTTGAPVATYYNQRAHAQTLIYDAIDEYIGSPSWTDYRGVSYVQSMIAAYYNAYAAKMNEAYAKQYFTTTYLGVYAKQMGREATWNNYLKALDLCTANKMLDSSNSQPSDIVPMMVQSLEALPDPSTVTAVSDVLREEIIKLYQAYNCLNYGQLKAFGSYKHTVTNADGTSTTMLYEEEKLLAYVRLLADQLDEDATVTGYRMANYPFILFNKFEDNTAVGDKALHLEDDPNYSGTADYRHVKPFSVLVTGEKKVVDGNGHTIGQLYDDVHKYANAGDTYITENGYNGSKGLTTTFNSAALQGDANGGVLYAMYINKNSVNTATDFTAFKANNMASVNLGQLAKNNDDAMSGKATRPDGSYYMPFSLVMYVDFSEFTAESGAGTFTWGVKIHTTNASGEEICYRPAMGSSSTWGGKDYYRTYYLMDQDPASPTFGEWQRVYAAERGTNTGNYMFPSETTNPNTAAEGSLAGYKGYIAIPMNHFKRAALDTEFLVNKATEMNNIYSITIGITNSNGAAMANKSFTIDNIGFTYDPEFYKDKLKVDTSSRNDLSYAEVFGAKSSKSVDFENAVAAIDPYAQADAFRAAYEKANALYENELQAWQKENVKTVMQAKAQLDVYKTYYDGTAQPLPADLTVAQLQERIAALSDDIPVNIMDAGYNMQLPKPGFLADASKPTTPGEVNYAAFGFTSREEAQQIAALYTNTYKRLSETDKATMSKAEKDRLVQAYNAAMRCLGTMEMIKENAVKFSENLTDLYKPYTEADGQTLRLIHATDRNTVATLSANEYDPLAYYAKAGLSGDDTYEAGTIIPAYKGMTDGLSRYLANVKTNAAGEVTDGGVKVLMDKYTALYGEVKTVLDAKQLLSDDLYARLKDAISEYNDLIPAYKNIFELYYGSNEVDTEEQSGPYYGIKDILELFPVYDLSFGDSAGVKEATLSLTDDNQDTASESLRVRYLEEVPSDEALTSYFTIAYDGLLESGAVNCAYELYINGKKVDTLTADGTAFKITAADLGLTNNTYTPDAPSKLEFKAKVTGKATAVMPLSDTAEIKFFAEDGTQIGDTSYLLHINYTPDETYVVYIPAEIPVDWGTTEQDASYKVDCALLEGSSVNVGVTAAQSQLANAGTESVIPYSLANGDTATFTGSCQQKTPDLLPTLEIAAASWNNIPVARYADTLTYTVTYNKTQTP